MQPGSAPPSACWTLKSHDRSPTTAHSPIPVYLSRSQTAVKAADTGSPALLLLRCCTRPPRRSRSTKRGCSPSPSQDSSDPLPRQTPHRRSSLRQILHQLRLLRLRTQTRLQILLLLRRSHRRTLPRRQSSLRRTRTLLRRCIPPQPYRPIRRETGSKSLLLRCRRRDQRGG